MNTNFYLCFSLIMFISRALVFCMQISAVQTDAFGLSLNQLISLPAFNASLFTSGSIWQLIDSFMSAVILKAFLLARIFADMKNSPNVKGLISFFFCSKQIFGLYRCKCALLNCQQKYGYSIRLHIQARWKRSQIHIYTFNMHALARWIIIDRLSHISTHRLHVENSPWRKKWNIHHKYDYICMSAIWFKWIYPGAVR